MKGKIRLFATLIVLGSANVAFAQTVVGGSIIKPVPPEIQPTTVTARLTGLEEVPPVFTQSHGSFTALQQTHASIGCRIMG